MSNILIVVPDMTRKAHLKDLLPRLLRWTMDDGRGTKDACPPKPWRRRKGRLSAEALAKAEGTIKIIVATGLHKPHTRAELKDLVGEKIFSKYTVIAHTQKKSDLVYRGKTKDGIPIVLNKNLFEADYIVTIGLIEPHLYAGYSGGAKTVAIGLAGEETINATHHPRFLDKPGTAIGAVKNNPFQDCLWKIIKDLPINHAVNIVNDRNGKLKRVFTGDLKRVFYKGVKFAKKTFERRIDKCFDAVICKVSPPKDVNLYQASRAFNYILNTKRPIVKKGGIVLVRASLKEGFGAGIAEKRFAGTLKNMRSPEGLVNIVKKKGCVAGQHRAYMVAKAMAGAKLGFIGPRAAICTENLPFVSFPTVKSAVKFIKNTKGRDAKIYIIHNSLSMIISSA